MNKKKISTKQLSAAVKYNPNTHWTHFEKRLKPRSDEDIEILAKHGVTFCAGNENVIKISQWYMTVGILPDTWLDYCKRNAIAEQAHQQMLMIIGNRRELDAYTKKADPNTALLTMPLYDKDWKKLCEWRASLRNKDTEKTDQKIIVIERFTNKSKNNEEEIVIEKKDEDEITS
jgi:hypothetical protein